MLNIAVIVLAAFLLCGGVLAAWQADSEKRARDARTMEGHLNYKLESANKTIRDLKDMITQRDKLIVLQQEQLEDLKRKKGKTTVQLTAQVERLSEENAQMRGQLEAMEHVMSIKGHETIEKGAEEIDAAATTEVIPTAEESQYFSALDTQEWPSLVPEMPEDPQELKHLVELDAELLRQKRQQFNRAAKALGIRAHRKDRGDKTIE